jgi:hypothetical protein
MMVTQELQLLGGLDTLGDDFQFQVMGHGDDGERDGGVVGIGGDIANECPIDL